MLELRQPPEALGQVPVAVAEQLHRRRQEHRSDDGGVDEDGGGEADAELLHRLVAAGGIANVTTITAAALVITPAGAALRTSFRPRATPAASPYADATFDGAYLVAVLGEIPDQDAALRELARVLRPGGRLVVGELFGDPHWVSPGRLRERGERAGFTFARQLGSPLGSFGRFQR